MVSFVRGLTYPLRGLSFALRHRALLRFFPGPILLGLALVVGEILALRFGIHRFLAQSSGWVIALAWLGGLLGAVLVFLALQGVLAAPFCDALSARVEALSGAPPPSAGLSGTALSIGHAALRALAYLGLLVILFLVGLFVPGMWLASILVSSLYAALDYLDYPTTRRRWSLAQKLDLVGRHKGAAIGFGLAASVLTAVPLLGLAVAPMAAVGGTLLFLDLQASKR